MAPNAHYHSLPPIFTFFLFSCHVHAFPFPFSARGNFVLTMLATFLRSSRCYSPTPCLLYVCAIHRCCISAVPRKRLQKRCLRAGLPRARTLAAATPRIPPRFGLRRGDAGTSFRALRAARTGARAPRHYEQNAFVPHQHRKSTGCAFRFPGKRGAAYSVLVAWDGLCLHAITFALSRHLLLLRIAAARRRRLLPSLMLCPLSGATCGRWVLA